MYALNAKKPRSFALKGWKNLPKTTFNAYMVACFAFFSQKWGGKRTKMRLPPFCYIFPRFDEIKRGFFTVATGQEKEGISPLSR